MDFATANGSSGKDKSAQGRLGDGLPQAGPRLSLVRKLNLTSLRAKLCVPPRPSQLRLTTASFIIGPGPSSGHGLGKAGALAAPGRAGGV